ncbi:hypothetical protein EV2_016323 [Malus domestica]
MATSRHLHLVPACHVFESTFKNQASTALEEASSQIQDQALTAFEEITSPIQDQASTIFESNPVQDQSCGKSTSATKYVPIHPLPKPKIIYHMKLLVVQFQPSRSSLDGP